MNAGAEMLANRLRKNRRLLGGWATREGITCYRLYDADLPEYAVAIDLYQALDAAVLGEAGQAGPDARRHAPAVWAHVQEYAPPASVDAERAAARLRDVGALLPDVLGVPPDHVVLKVRQRQRGLAQYERQAASGEFLEVGEGGLRFLVNLRDYLDTGLFLDHRPTRAMIRAEARGRRFLNLFAYTGTASVYAAAGGAASTTSVDMSAVYLDWARRNMTLNGLTDAGRHHFARADCLRWLAEAPPARFDLIFLDPPTFSTSKRMGERTLDAQRDHVALIRAAVRLLAPAGLLFFSTNFRRFRMDRPALADLVLEDLTAATIPRDFARNPKIHACWRIARRS
jgi:23S rRNA (guanine2445-N2)-methyltransferase / 23S rRNA (guanine2069-N7)-methyltransferase